MKKIVLIILVLTGFFPALLHAQDSTLQNLPAQWSLQDCIEYAKQHNIQISTLKLNTSAAQEDLLQAQAAKLPNLSGTLSQNLVNSKNADPVVGGLQTQANFSSSYGVSSSLTLYNGGYIRNDVKSKELAIQSANLTVQETENDITLSITQAYLNVLLAKETITSLQNVLETSQAQEKQGQQRFDAGSISKKDLVQLEAQVASDQYNLVNAQNNYRLNVVSLKQLLQLPTSYDFIPAAVTNVTVKETVPDLSAAQQIAQNSRPEIKNGIASFMIAQTELEKVKAGVRPTVSLGANLSTGYSDNQSYKYTSQLNSNFYQSLGLNVSIPIYSRRVNKTNINKSKIQIEQAKLSLENTKTTLNQQVEQAYINLQNAQAQYTAAEAQLKANEESYNITNEQLKLGAINVVELQQQKSLYTQSLQAYLQAKYTAVLYNKIYNFYTGVPVAF